MHAEIGKMAPSFGQLRPPSSPDSPDSCHAAGFPARQHLGIGLPSLQHISVTLAFLTLSPPLTLPRMPYPASHFLHVPRDCTLTCSRAFSDLGVTCPVPRGCTSRLASLPFGLSRRRLASYFSSPIFYFLTPSSLPRRSHEARHARRSLEYFVGCLIP